MAKRNSLLRRALYRVLPFRTYLWVLSKLYFLAYRKGLLKGDDFFAYQYFIQNIVNEGDVCIDIGANMGYFTVPLARLAGKDGKVYAVEPVKPVLDILKINTGKLDNVEILPFALGAENKTIRLANDSMKTKGYVASGSHFVLENSNPQNDKVVTFDAEMRKASQVFKDLKRLDFVKCDVEGYEVHIIPQIMSLIKKFRPVLIIETSGDARKTLINLFKENNFNAYVLHNGKMEPVSTTQHSGDLILVPDEKTHALRSHISQ